MTAAVLAGPLRLLLWVVVLVVALCVLFVGSAVVAVIRERLHADRLRRKRELEATPLATDAWEVIEPTVRPEDVVPVVSMREPVRLVDPQTGETIELTAREAAAVIVALQADHADALHDLGVVELYNPESPDRGTSEVLVAKHRAGPTGMDRLAFLDHYTRFANMARNI